MVAEAEKFAAEDESSRKRIEALNALSAFVYGLRSQVTDSEGLGGKISDEDKKTILDAVKETTDWLDENGASATEEDLEEKLAGMFLSFIPQAMQMLTTLCRGPGCRQPHNNKTLQWRSTALFRRRRGVPRPRRALEWTCVLTSHTIFYYEEGGLALICRYSDGVDTLHRIYGRAGWPAMKRTKKGHLV